MLYQKKLLCKVDLDATDYSVDKQKMFEYMISKHEVPHKFAYLDDGAEIWDILSKDLGYDLGNREQETLDYFLQQLSPEFDKQIFNILHIGTGNGKEIPIIINRLGIQHITNYILLDISPELLTIAESYAKEQYNTFEFSKMVHDITDENISNIVKKIPGNGVMNLILIIGNGFILSEPHVLTNVRKLMSPDDRLLITLEIYSEERDCEILKQFMLPSIINLFAQSLSLIGIENPSVDEFEFVYNKEKSMIEVYFLANHWFEIHNNDKSNFDISLPDRIKVFTSLRPTASRLKELLIENGFHIEQFHYFDQDYCCGVLCSKR